MTLSGICFTEPRCLGPRLQYNHNRHRLRRFRRLSKITMTLRPVFVILFSAMFVCLATQVGSAAESKPERQLEIEPSQRIALVGNSTAERMNLFGHFETGAGKRSHGKRGHRLS